MKRRWWCREWHLFIQERFLVIISTCQLGTPHLETLQSHCWMTILGYGISRLIILRYGCIAFTHNVAKSKGKLSIK